LPRKKRLWTPNVYYHIGSRGNRRDALFMDRTDYKVFLSILHHVNEKAPFTLASYCLMTNHYHLLMSTSEQPISKVMSMINKRYADYYNTKNNTSGHVFEKRYFDKPIGTPYGILEISRYIHLNPVKAGIAKSAEDYKWSSYPVYFHNIHSSMINKNEILKCFSGDERERSMKYHHFLNKEDEKIYSTNFGE